LAKILFTPSGFESPSFNATLGRWFLFEQIERQHILAVLLFNLPGEFRQAAHRVDAHDAASQFQLPQQKGQRRAVLPSMAIGFAGKTVLMACTHERKHAVPLLWVQTGKDLAKGIM